jgi:hypothetical protein
LYSKFATNWKSRMKTKSIATSINGLKWFLPVYAPWMRSFPCVSGEKNAIICTMQGSDARGMKTPDMNMRGKPVAKRQVARAHRLNSQFL